MKVLKFHDSRDEDYLLLSFNGAFSPQVDLESEFAFFFQAFEEYAGGWMPDVVRGKRQRRYSRAAIWKSLEEDRDENITSIGLYRTEWPALDMSLSLWLPPRHPKLNIIIKVKPLSFFAETECCRHFVEMVRAWADRYPVTYAWAHSSDDAQLADFPSFGRDDETRRRDGFDKIYEVCWLNVFGPKLVETVGRERMLSTPAHRVEELPTGSVLIVTWPTVADFASKEARLAQARAHAHLRPDLDYDTALRTLSERSTILAPVERRFHPDVSPLLTRVVDFVASHERQRKIAGFNVWQPPEPEEWRPADSALPPDVDDPEGALEHYDTLAEHLVALLHTEVPSVFEATPGSLVDVDFYFWREEFPTSRLREAIDEHAIPAIGAYLGEVMVRNLGGRWIPRKKLEEAQVLVGNRVWLPFVRARHYMRSRQALLDYSLTRIYRVAERHRG
ncbi:hypothetical protein JQX13_46395 [Archangium violaceum]|uniref:hypothetical protein n=1 Tax=Archangium violaceum TaxID=83451 RepID=UPI00193C5C7A|nr:hypothetical protein [Archangium violaceum]QRK07381.1 hypothetical protein JQX13_46395 [Archangium violaceum]